MIKKTFFLVLAILFLALLSPALVQAQGGLKVLDNWAEPEFPAKISFGLSASSGVEITDIRLNFTVDRVSFAEVTSEVFIEFAPGSEVNAEWTLDMRKVGGMPPGATLSYWWTVKDASDDVTQTAPIEVKFDDARFSWRSITQDKLTLYWYQGDESFAQELMTTAQEALSRLEMDTGAHLKRPSLIYIYANADELRGAMIYPQEWTGGVAFTSYGAIAIGIEPDNLLWGKTAMTHELTHLVISQMTLNPYNNLPIWLDEGLATYSEEFLHAQYALALAMAVDEGRLFSVRSLSSPFSAEAGKAVLSYAQSYSIVSFLISSYGQEKMLKLLNIFEQGSTYDGALEKVYGFDMGGLDELWQEYLREQYQSATQEQAYFKPAEAALVLAY